MIECALNVDTALNGREAGPKARLATRELRSGWADYHLPASVPVAGQPPFAEPVKVQVRSSTPVVPFF